MIKLKLFGILLVLWCFHSFALSEAQESNELFAKLHQNIENKNVPVSYGVGSNMLKGFIELSIRYPNRDDEVPELLSVAKEIVDALPIEMNIGDTMLTWQSFLDLMSEAVYQKDLTDYLFYQGSAKHTEVPVRPYLPATYNKKIFSGFYCYV